MARGLRRGWAMHGAGRGRREPGGGAICSMELRYAGVTVVGLCRPRTQVQKRHMQLAGAHAEFLHRLHLPLLGRLPKKHGGAASGTPSSPPRAAPTCTARARLMRKSPTAYCTPSSCSAPRCFSCVALSRNACMSGPACSTCLAPLRHGLPGGAAASGWRRKGTGAAALPACRQQSHIHLHGQVGQIHPGGCSVWPLPPRRSLAPPLTPPPSHTHSSPPPPPASARAALT